jgi:hypothetical protein
MPQPGPETTDLHKTNTTAIKQCHANHRPLRFFACSLNRLRPHRTSLQRLAKKLSCKSKGTQKGRNKHHITARHFHPIVDR